MTNFEQKFPTMTDTIIRSSLSDPSGVGLPARIYQKPTDRIVFEDGYFHYLHADALKGLTGLTVRGLKSAQIHFLGDMNGSQLFESDGRPDCGVLNFVDCTDVLVTGANVENKKTFESGNAQSETSCAVNVQDSRMRFERCHFKSNGKQCLIAHSDSYLELVDVSLHGYYFELVVRASKIIADNLQLWQAAPHPDSHSAIWVSSSMRQAITNDLFAGTDVEIRNSKFNMFTGRSLVSGNGSYDTRSKVRLVDNNVVHDLATFGVCAFHGNYHSLDVEIDAPELPDYVSTPNVGFAKYVNYYENPTAPGGSNFDSNEYPHPITVNGRSSDDVWSDSVSV